MEQLYLDMASAFQEEIFLQRLSEAQLDAADTFDHLDWQELLSPLLPLERRIICTQALEIFRPEIGRAHV